MIITPYNSLDQNELAVSSPCTTGALIVVRDNPLCVVIRNNDIGVTPAHQFAWPDSRDPWPLSRQWTVSLSAYNGCVLYLVGRQKLIVGGWEFVERLFEGERDEVEVAWLELKAEEARDWLIALLREWRDGTLNYMEIAEVALEAIDSSVGINLQMEGVDAFTALAELTTISKEPDVLDEYIDSLLARI